MKGKYLSFFLILLIIGVSGVSAQDSNQSKTVLVELDGATWISDVDWSPPNSTLVKVTIQSEVPKSIGLQEMPDYSGRSGSFAPMQQFTLSSGENVVKVPYNGKSTRGIVITSRNSGAYYQQQPDNIPDPSSLDTIPIAIYGAFSTFMVFVMLRGWSKFQLKRGLIRE